MRKNLRTRPHCDICPLRQSAHRENKNCGIFATFLFLDSRSSFSMTIWSGRTQRSIASGFAAASVNGNRTLRSVVPSGGAYSTAWCRAGVVYRTAWRHLWAPPRQPLLSPRAKENLPSLMLSHQLKKWEEITVEKPSVSRSVCRLLCATYARCAVRVPHGGG